MDTPASASASTLHGIVYSVPAGRRIAGAVVRFFEFRSERGGHDRRSAEEIVQEGLPIGSAITNDKGEFSLPYSAPKGDVAIGFVVLGPEMGTADEFLSWSASPRRVGAGSEAFLVGIDEREIAKRRLRDNAEYIKKIRAKEDERREELKAFETVSTEDRLSALRWAPTLRMPKGDPKGQAGDPWAGKEIDVSELKPGEHRELNASLIYSLHARLERDHLTRSGAPRSGKREQRKNTEPKGRARLGLESETILSGIHGVLDLLAPQLKKKAEERRERVGLDPWTSSTYEPPDDSFTKGRFPRRRG
jgi:hypothetical protein